MALVTTIHLHNVPEAREAEYAAWFDGPHREAVSWLRGFQGAERYEVTPAQIMSFIPQPWKFLSVYDFDLPDPKIDIPALGPLIADARDAGLIDDTGETERLYSYAMRSDWKGSPNWQQDKPFSGVSIILANYVAGRKEEYDKWYDEVHSVEVTNVPGHVAMKRGQLTETQVEPRRYCPGDQLVLCAQQTDDLAFTVKDFSDRAQGKSPSGIAMEPRSDSGSFARTVHYFGKVSGSEFWPGGIAYAGDLSVYPGKE
ncbi:hypothetical protein [Stakelama tenebrarum]|uniref:Uncharacterized protein n=1 Tax=Stakelama tenebrarum TaxID=2711215 RepID=A0A6G6Y7H3_9SPHN|nr:hypothetical protein [Sphingosinithalassobacter tenebrarum]QIG80747.1 hypothetical protein G5C33_13770 [Sphingosinithalassobacter tenebrarum]